MKLYQACLPLLVFAGVFKQTPDLASASYDDVRSDVDKLLLQMRMQCADVPEKEYKEAFFAVCAFVDEAILTSNWTEKLRWQASTLQRTCFGTVNAGVEFYDHLRRLLGKSTPASGQNVVELTSILPDSSFRRHEETAFSRIKAGVSGFCQKGLGLIFNKKKPASAADNLWTTAMLQTPSANSTDNSKTDSDFWQEDVLSVYGACMAMGFKGQYYDAREQDALYAMTMDSLKKGIGSRIAPGQRFFSPESYYMPEATGPRRHMNRAVRFVLYAVPVAVTLALYMAYSHAISAFTSHWIRALGG